MSRRSKSRVLISAAVFILLEIAAFAIIHSSSTIQNIWLNRASYRVMALLWGSSEKLSSLFHLRSISDKLNAENAALRERLALLEQAQSSIAGAAAVPASADANFRYTAASIVKMSRNAARNYMIINKGSLDGIKPQTGVITENGVVGIVSSVSDHYSYALSFANPEFRVGVKIGPENINALLHWDGLRSNGALAIDVPAHKSIAPGDTLRTSGFSSFFPADIPIGIAGNSTLVDGSSWTVEVELFQDMSSLRYVIMTENLRRSEIEALEKEGQDE